MEQQIYSVTQINTYIQSMMDSDRLLSGLCIRGEISNYKVYPSGHHYFSLKDATGALRCVMFKSSAIRLRFRPEPLVPKPRASPHRLPMSARTRLFRRPVPD